MGGSFGSLPCLFFSPPIRLTFYAHFIFVVNSGSQLLVAGDPLNRVNNKDFGDTKVRLLRNHGLGK